MTYDLLCAQLPNDQRDAADVGGTALIMAAIERLSKFSLIVADSCPKLAVMVQHYLYFPTEEASASAAAELQRKGFATEKRLGADHVNWLVLASQPTPPSGESVELARETLEAIAGQFGGEYDGWEAEVADAAF